MWHKSNSKLCPPTRLKILIVCRHYRFIFLVTFLHVISRYLAQEVSLTHWGRVTHICVTKLIIIASDNGLSPGRCQAIIWTNAGILFIGHLRTNFSEIVIGIHTFSLKKIHWNVSSGKWRPFCLGLNVLICLAMVSIDSVHSISYIQLEYNKTTSHLLYKTNTTVVFFLVQDVSRHTMCTEFILVLCCCGVVAVDFTHNLQDHFLGRENVTIIPIKRVKTLFKHMGKQINDDITIWNKEQIPTKSRYATMIKITICRLCEFNHPFCKNYKTTTLKVLVACGKIRISNALQYTKRFPFLSVSASNISSRPLWTSYM